MRSSTISVFSPPWFRSTSDTQKRGLSSRLVLFWYAQLMGRCRATMEPFNTVNERVRASAWFAFRLLKDTLSKREIRDHEQSSKTIK